MKTRKGRRPRGSLPLANIAKGRSDPARKLAGVHLDYVTPESKRNSARKARTSPVVPGPEPFLVLSDVFWRRGK